MHKSKLCVLALILAAVVLLGGCMAEDGAVSYEKMQYERPDMTALQQALDAACEAATGEDPDAILDAVYRFYDAYDWFYTCATLADLHYCADLTDFYWQQESDYCAQHSAEVDAALETLNYSLAHSPCREALEAEFFGVGFFDGYDGENLWEGELMQLLSQEAQLQNQYYALSEEALDYDPGTEEYYDACADGMAQLLVDLIELRQEIADCSGYRDYTQFAYDFYYYRDYTPRQAEAYLEQIRQALVPLYRETVTEDVWNPSYVSCSEKQALDYVRKTAKNLGGTMEAAFQLMERAGLYDIAYGPNKYNASFEVYLTSYCEPFVFLNPTLTACDKLSLVHEFGHFCNDYASYGSYAGVDVSEFFSQGMEYLSLCYGDGTLAQVKMADSLSIYVEQAAYASFEHQMYRLTGEDLTVEALYSLYEETVASYGLDNVEYDRREFVDITHFYTNPMYIISYVVSNDAAMQLYQLEQSSNGAGKALYEENLATEEWYFLEFLDSAGLESPFVPGRIQEVKATFEALLR